MVDIKEIVESKFKESRKKVIAKHDEMLGEIEKELRSGEEKVLDKFRKLQ
ncbi:MAG: hypothetical protein H3Z50_07000 [archaeon]|nr:hypothetical protein [archaeon]